MHGFFNPLQVYLPLLGRIKNFSASLKFWPYNRNKIKWRYKTEQPSHIPDYSDSNHNLGQQTLLKERWASAESSNAAGEGFPDWQQNLLNFCGGMPEEMV